MNTQTRATAQNVNGNAPSTNKVIDAQKKAKADAKAEAKAKTQAVKDTRRATIDLWNEENRSISGIGKWAKETMQAKNKSAQVQKQKLTDFTNAINAKYGTQITPATINKRLLKFGYVHELNKVDDDYKVIEQKRLFSINFMLTLIERRAKIKSNETEFAKLQKKAKANFLERAQVRKEREENETSFQAYAVALIEEKQS